VSFLILAEYLDANESASLREKLAAAGIGSTVKRHGLPFSLGAEVNYKVIINRADFEKSRAVYLEFRSELEKSRAEKKTALARQCPACGSQNITTVQKSSLWRRIRFAGVDVKECRACGSVWYL
jgi:hypothetical protein